MKIRSIYLLCVVFLMSCNHTAKKMIKTVNIKSDSIKKSIIVQSTNDTLVIPDDTLPKITISDGTVQVGQLLIDTNNKVKILESGSIAYHDDIDPEDVKLDWKGIFYNKDSFYIKPTKIKITSEHSEMDEEENQKTGWKIKCDVKDSCFILISGVDNLVKGTIKRFPWHGGFDHAGQKKVFNYEGVTYTLYTTGAKRNGKACNVKLFLMASVKGHSFNQLIESLGPEPTEDDPDTIYITFIGDIDGDKIPDFITSVSGYGGGSTTVYLSQPAGDNAVLKPIGLFSTTD
jgi:hypothetical protein